MAQYLAMLAFTWAVADSIIPSLSHGIFIDTITHPNRSVKDRFCFPYNTKKMKGAVDKMAALLAFLVALSLGNAPIAWAEMV